MLPWVNMNIYEAVLKAIRALHFTFILDWNSWRADTWCFPIFMLSSSILFNISYLPIYFFFVLHWNRTNESVQKLLIICFGTKDLKMLSWNFWIIANSCNNENIPDNTSAKYPLCSWFDVYQKFQMLVQLKKRFTMYGNRNLPTLFFSKPFYKKI